MVVAAWWEHAVSFLRYSHWSKTTQWQAGSNPAHYQPYEQAKKALPSGGVSFVAEESGHLTGHKPAYESFRIGVIPDCQVKPNVDISHLSKIIVDRVCITC